MYGALPILWRRRTTNHRLADSRPRSAVMEADDVRRITRSVILDYGLPCALVDVQPAAGRWHVTVRHDTGQTSARHLSGDRPAALRAAIKEWLDSESD